ncbi:hypothetical protein XELAEV_18016387mg [Xenopus laevis]|uniref:Rho guanine nucleotide exchange factor 17 n=1 Tax=Xenopus laevis TaxID=8355 RepID=A0A974HX23_XENLA|nr:hypothetical protein XELAEV_18016387mg [Xenopus laevis]
MAEGNAERKVRMYRSVSFKRLENWNAKGFVLEGGTKLPGEGDVTQPTCQKAQRPSRSLSLSRKVSKISAASKDQISPSVRQLSQRFSSQPRDEGAQCGEENSHLNKGCQEEHTLDLPCLQDQQGQDPLTVTVRDDPGKSDDLLAYVNPRASKSSATLLDELTLNSYYSLLNHPDNREIIGVEENWPSVTEMRKLFGENSRKPNVRASSLPDYDEPRLLSQQFSYLREATDSHRPCPVESAFPRDFNAADFQPKHPTLKIENSHSRNLLDSRPDINSILCMDTKDHRSNSGPKPQPPTPPPRSFIPFGLKAHTLSSGVPKQEARQQSVSLHSLHSSGKPQTAPSNVRLGFSSSEEELRSKALQLPSSPNKNEFQDRSQEVSSGSDEESNRVTLRESLRNRSLRRKKKDLEEYKSHLSGESNAKHVISDAADGDEVGQDANHSEYPLHGTNIYETTSAETMGANAAANKPSSNLASGTSNESPRHHLRGISEGLSPSAACHLSAASPMPTVSRVAKVNIPPFLPSPCGSRSSSRYSSTETLKEDDPFNAYSSGQSRQGGLNIYRSPSFGHNDNVRQQARSRLKVAPNVAKLKSENFHEVSSCDPESENSKYTKSMSDPDIASETLNLLSFLQSDISDLKIRHRGSECTDRDGVTAKNESVHGPGGQESWANKGRSVLQSMSHSQQGNRPTLRDLTATLRRTKSFTYSEKLGSRRRVGHGSMKQSSSELSLASTGDEDLLSNSKTNEDVTKQGEDAASALSHDQYIQEARQVFEKISQIGSQDDYSFDQEVSKHLENKMVKSLPLDCTSHCLEKNCNTFIENMSLTKSLEELSHHEFAMTDEGIVTEVETVSGGTLYQDLGQALTVWKTADKLQGDAHPFTVQNGEIQQSPSAVKTTFEIDSCCDVLTNKSSFQVPVDTPPMAGTMRRRRKFPSLSINGSDSSNGSSGESGSETYRSFSDPMPHRTYSITEDSKFSVDSNLLGSLNSKTGNSESSAIAFSECTGSAASVLSFSSDGVKDYNTVIQNIVSQPGALDKVIDEKGNGKTIKKKSFSDPSRRGELSPTSLENSTEPINELSCSSEPILTEQRDESGEVEDAEKVVGRVRSQSECILPHAEDDSGVEANQNFSFDPKLAEVLSPRTVRRSSKKRTNRVQEGPQECNESTEALGKSRVTSKHLRHTSEPSTFIPIVSADAKSSSHPVVQLTIPESAKLPVKPLPSLICPQLEDVSKQGRHVTGDTNTPSAGDLPRTAPSTPTSAEPKLLRLHKPHEDITPGNRSKPYVVSSLSLFFIFSSLALLECWLLKCKLTVHLLDDTDF